MSPLTVTTSEAHLLTVARHYDLVVTLEGDELVTHRLLEGIGDLIYRAPLRMEVSA